MEVLDVLLRVWGALAPFAVLLVTVGLQKRKADRALVDGKADAELVARLAIRVEGIEDRATRIESAIEHLPDKDRMHGMELALKSLQGEIAVLAERLKPVSAIGERLQEFLLEQSKVTR